MEEMLTDYHLKIPNRVFKGLDVDLLMIDTLIDSLIMNYPLWRDSSNRDGKTFIEQTFSFDNGLELPPDAFECAGILLSVVYPTLAEIEGRLNSAWSWCSNNSYRMDDMVIVDISVFKKPEG